MAHRLGLLGVGRLGSRLGEQCRRHPDVELVALADIADDVLAQEGRKLTVPPEARYPNLNAMLAGAELDAIAISTPHTLHYEQILRAFDHGLDVLCEKPLVVDVEEARDLCDRVEISNETLLVGYQRHFEEPYCVARERLRDANPAFITAEIVEDWIDPNVGTWRVDPELSGGGFLCDTGSHVVDAVLWMTGLQPTTVSAEMDFYDDRVDQSATVRIGFENGATANLSFNGDLPRVREHYHVWGAEGGVYLDGREWDERELRFVDKDGTERSPLLDETFAAAGQHRSKIDVFVSVLDGTIEPPATAQDALKTTAVVDAAYRSAVQREPVEVDLT